MRFAAPQYLWLLATLLPVLAIILWRARSDQVRRLRAYWGESSDKQLGRILAKAKSPWQPLVMTLSLALLIVAMARPQWGFTWKRASVLGKDVFLVVDVSNSMLAQDVRPSRLEQARREVFDLLNAQAPARIGLIVFAGTAFVYCPLTNDHDAIRMFVEDMDPSMMSRQGTSLGEAISMAAERLKIAAPEESAGKAIIVLTDGEEQELQAEDAVKKAVAEGIDFAFMGIGTPDGAPIPQGGGGFKKDDQGKVVVSRLGESSLQALAKISNGVYVRADAGDADLNQVLPVLRGGDPSKNGEREGERQKVYQEQYVWFVLLAFLLLFGESLSKIGWWNWSFSQTQKNRQQMLAFLIIWLLSTTVSTNVYADTRREAHAAFERGEFADAAGKFLELEVDEPTREQHTYNRAVSQFHSQQFDDARAGFTRAAQSADQSLAARSLFNLGNTEVARGDLNAAIAAYEKALQIEPQDEATQENLAWAKEQLKKKQQQQETKRDESQQSKSDQDKQDPQKNSDHQGSSQNENSQADQKNHAPQDKSASKDAAQNGSQQSQQQSAGEKKADQSMAEGQSQQEQKTDGHGQTQAQKAGDDRAQAGTSPTDATSLDQEQAKRTLRRVKDAKHRRIQPSQQDQPGKDDSIDESRRDW